MQVRGTCRKMLGLEGQCGVKLCGILNRRLRIYGKKNYKDWLIWKGDYCNGMCGVLRLLVSIAL